MADPETFEPDDVDRKLEVWARELPTLDLLTEGIVERIQTIEKYLARSMNETLGRYDLSWGEWKVLGSLRYSGPPYRVSPGQLSRWLELSSGAMTNRLDRMEQAGLIRRLPDPDDRRALQIELTEAGWKLWQESVAVQAEKEALVASMLDEAEKRRLNDLLRRLLNAFAAEHGALKPREHEPDAAPADLSNKTAV
jgi:DNA-binding MarR family transcriptional regulator